MHNGFEGKASSVGERSMLGVFREVAIAIDNEPVGQLATFDRMFEGIRGAHSKSGIQSAINTAERNLGDLYAIRVLKALFLVKHVKEFSYVAQLERADVERFGEDVPAQRKRLEAALNLLEQQTA